VRRGRAALTRARVIPRQGRDLLQERAQRRDLVDRDPASVGGDQQHGFALAESLGEATEAQEARPCCEGVDATAQVVTRDRGAGVLLEVAHERRELGDPSPEGRDEIGSCPSEARQ
jgi:hypothetical protein